MNSLKKYFTEPSRLAWLVLAVIAFGLYFNSINNEFALDDKMVIQNNEYTQQGIRGINDILTHDMMAGMFGEDASIVQGGRYRPLSMITFAVGQSVFNGDPHVMHFFNVIFYVLAVLLLYKVLLRLFPGEEGKNVLLSVPFIASLIFATHPIHTEIVANIKGRDEILSFIGAFSALWFSIRYTENKKLLNILWIFISFFLALMSKEVAVTFLFVIPFSIWFFKRTKGKDVFVSLIPALIATAVYLLIRVSVLGQLMGEESGQLMNNPFLEADTGEKYATIFYTLGLYIKLLIIPHPLTWDYYPYHIELINWTDVRAIIPLIIYLILIFLAFYGLKKRKIYSWAIWFFIATLSITSNLVINIGAFMSERFLFFSSVAFAVPVAFYLSKLQHIKNGKRVILSVLIILTALYTLKTVTRNKHWENSLILFGHDVKISENSAKGNSSYASELYSVAEEKSDKQVKDSILKSAVPYFNKALEIYPEYIEPLIRLANIRYIVYNDVEGMIDYYIRVLKISPENIDAWGNIYGVLANNVDKPLFEIKTWKRINKIHPNHKHPELWKEMGKLYLNKRYKPDSAIRALKKAHKIAPNDTEVLRMMGFASGTMNRPQKAREYFKKLIKIKPKDAQALKFIGISYGMENKHKKAIEYLERSLQINPNDKQARQNLENAKRILGGGAKER